MIESNCCNKQNRTNKSFNPSTVNLKRWIFVFSSLFVAPRPSIYWIAYFIQYLFSFNVDHDHPRRIVLIIQKSKIIKQKKISLYSLYFHKCNVVTKQTPGMVKFENPWKDWQFDNLNSAKDLVGWLRGGTLAA